MACGGCKQRRQLLSQAAKAAFKGDRQRMLDALTATRQSARSDLKRLASTIIVNRPKPR